MADQLSESRVAEFKAVFDLFDKDGDGSISSSELGDIMKNLGNQLSPADVEAMIGEVDIDKDGSIDFNEFLNLMTRRGGNTSAEDEMREAFRVFDQDGNGYISAAELQSVMASLGEKLTPQQVQDMISECDTNGDGQIDYNEFVYMMSRM